MEKVRERKTEVKEMKKKREEKQKELEEKRKEKSDAKKAEEEEKKKAEMDERIAKIKEKADNWETDRKAKIDEMKEETKKLVQKEPYFKKIENRYEQKVLMPTLEEKKKQLATIRSLHSPINTDSLLEHSKKVQALAEEKKKALKDKRMKVHDDHRKNYNYREFES